MEQANLLAVRLHEYAPADATSTLNAAIQMYRTFTGIGNSEKVLVAAAGAPVSLRRWRLVVPRIIRGGPAFFPAIQISLSFAPDSRSEALSVVFSAQGRRRLPPCLSIPVFECGMAWRPRCSAPARRGSRESTAQSVVTSLAGFESGSVARLLAGFAGASSTLAARRTNGDGDSFQAASKPFRGGLRLPSRYAAAASPSGIRR